ncbi:MAG: hypothetical protein ABMB14_24085 [Myxococcota bacterium]
MEPVTEQPPPLPEGVASPAPTGMLVVVWIGVFAVITWGFAILFRRLGPQSPPDPAPPADGADPRGDGARDPADDRDANG